MSPARRFFFGSGAPTSLGIGPPPRNGPPLHRVHDARHKNSSGPFPSSPLNTCCHRGDGHDDRREEGTWKRRGVNMMRPEEANEQSILEYFQTIDNVGEASRQQPALIVCESVNLFSVSSQSTNTPFLPSAVVPRAVQPRPKSEAKSLPRISVRAAGSDRTSK